MKTNKLGLLAALVVGGLLACGSMAFAQDAKDAPKGKRGGPSVEQQLETLKEKLTLTDAQQPKVKAVLEETNKKRREIRADTALSQDERREKAMALGTAQDKQLKEILTPDQFTKYEKVRDEMRANRGGGQGGQKKSEKKN